jgi:glyoxylase-like metal-dependent hydrolase (beta-lactamase superfamily II)
MSSVVFAQQDVQPQLNVETITENLSVVWDMMSGNTTVLSGEDGVLIIDTKTAGAAEMLPAKVSEISDKPVRYVILTHWHFDHVGGNETFGKAGATIVAHENVRKRLSTEQKIELFDTTYPPMPEAALPTVTFTKDLTLHFNGEDISIFQIGPGHTDGDGVVYFSKANVLHVGDLYFNGLYPYIGVPTGGSIDNMIEVGQNLLEMANDKTVIIPGHGPISNKAEYAEFLAMLTAIRDSIKSLIEEGKSVEEVVAAQPTQEFDAKWGDGFLKPADFTGLVYMDLSRN